MASRMRDDAAEAVMQGEAFEGTIETRTSDLLAHEFERVGNERQAETILLVEDEIRVRRVMSEVLQLRGYTVLEADNAEAALRVVRQSGKSVQLLVSDVVLPGKNGRDLAKELRRKVPGLKTILVSGYGESIALLGANCTTDIHYLSKPFSAASLIDAVEVTLKGKKRKATYR
jgi:two-component system, cell cycle sensor histidine kinase and response regulator CckA